MSSRRVSRFCVSLATLIVFLLSSAVTFARTQIRPCDFSRVALGMRVVNEPPEGYVYQYSSVAPADERGVKEEPFLGHDTKERTCSCWGVYDYYRSSDSSDFAYVLAQELTTYPIETQFVYSWRRPRVTSAHNADLTDCQDCERQVFLPPLVTEATYVSQWEPDASFYGKGAVWVHTTGAKKALVRVNIPVCPSQRTVAYAYCGGFVVQSAKLKVPVAYYHRDEPRDNPVRVSVYWSQSYGRDATWNSLANQLSAEEARGFLDWTTVNRQGEVLELDVSRALRGASPFSPVDFLLTAQGEIAKGVGFSSGVGNTPITLEVVWVAARCSSLR